MSCGISRGASAIINEYDQAARYVAKLDAQGFVRWLIPHADPALLFRGWLDTRTLPFPGERDRICDTVAALHIATSLDGAWVLVIEFQSEVDKEMLERVLEYVIRVRRELRYGPGNRFKYEVSGVLVNLTGPPQAQLLEMGLPQVKNVGLRFQVVVRTLRDESAAQTLRDISSGQTAPCILASIPLMRGGAKKDIITQRIQLAAREPDSRLRSTYAGLALVFAGLAKRLTLWKTAPEGWNMLTSPVIAEWREEGRKEGQVEIARDALLRVLQLRFPGQASKKIVSVIQAEADLDRLKQWHDSAVMAGSFKEFRAAMTP